MKKNLILIVLILFTSTLFAQKTQSKQINNLMNAFFTNMKNSQDLSALLYKATNVEVKSISVIDYKIVESDLTHAIVDVNTGSGTYCLRLHFKIKEVDADYKILGRYQSNTVMNPWWKKENLCD